MAHKMTKHLKFSEKARKEIDRRDGGQCFFCTQMYHMECKSPLLYQIKDIMHIVPKSSLGMGIPQNGVTGCRYHHGLLDNGNKGLRGEMLSMLERYLKSVYPGWCREEMKYCKYKEGL